MAEPNLTHVAQDYLKAVYHLGSSGKAVNTNDLAEALAVSPATVTGMLKRLSKEGYLDYRPRQGAGLTAKGLQAALEVIRHHRLLETFFVSRLGMDWSQAHREAETLEHFISEELEHLIDAAMGHPSQDPHGSPIPQPDGSIAEQECFSLACVPAPASYVIRRVRAESPELLDYLKRSNLVPGSVFELLAVEPFEGPLSLRLDGHVLHIGRKVGEAVFVQPLNGDTALSDDSNRSK